jgi:hypothetical protein
MHSMNSIISKFAYAWISISHEVDRLNSIWSWLWMFFYISILSEKYKIIIISNFMPTSKTFASFILFKNKHFRKENEFYAYQKLVFQC